MDQDNLAALQEEGYFRIQIGGEVYRLGEQTLPLPAAGLLKAL